jgi:hypothetical protein
MTYTVEVVRVRDAGHHLIAIPQVESHEKYVYSLQAAWEHRYDRVRELAENEALGTHTARIMCGDGRVL